MAAAKTKTRAKATPKAAPKSKPKKPAGDALLRRVRAAMKKAGVSAGPPATEAEVRAFEARAGISLPADYVRFLREVGNGATSENGVFDLRALGEAARGSAFEARALKSLQEPFPFTKANKRSFAPKAAMKAPSWQGCLPLGSDEDATWVLVVTGDERGNVWQVAPDGAAPNEPSRTFLAWYAHWLESGGADDWYEDAVDPDAEAKGKRSMALWDNHPLQKQREALVAATSALESNDGAGARRALAALEVVKDSSLAGQALFVRAVAAAILAKPDAERLAFEVADSWLGPSVPGAVNQGVLRSEVLSLLARFGDVAKEKIARVRTAPEPGGDFF